MPALTPSTVVTVRTVVTWTLRAIALAMVLVGAHYSIQRVMFYLFTGNADTAWRAWMEIGATSHRASIGASLALLGVGLALLSAPLARWITPFPPDGCPRCGYTRDEPLAESTPDETRCPECGLRSANASGAHRPSTSSDHAAPPAPPDPQRGR